MIVFVCSCDKNTETFEAFHHCIEKYWKNHPEVIYVTETVKNPYYKTINVNEPVEVWTKRIKGALKQINDDRILLMHDDLFIRNEVDEKRLQEALELVKGNVASVNLEKSFDPNDIEIAKGFKKRCKGSPYEVSLMYGIWDKDKLIDVLERNTDGWHIEEHQDSKGYDYLINGGDFIIDVGYTYLKHCGIKKGKWCREIVPFMEKEGIKIDYTKKGFYD